LELLINKLSAPDAKWNTKLKNQKKMNFNFSYKLLICVCLITFLTEVTLANTPAAKIAFENGFKTPPMTAKPQTWWHWINGHVSHEGITADLEAMKAKGLGGFSLFNVSEGTPEGPVSYMSDEWWSLLEHTKSEASRLGLEMGFKNGAGWSSSGGPWVTPDKAMQEVVWTEKRVTGPLLLDTELDLNVAAIGIERDMSRNPEVNKRYYVERNIVEGYYNDIVVLAFPTPKKEITGTPFLLKDWRGKAGYTKLRSYVPDERTANPSDVIQVSQIVDLTSKMDSKGRLRWNVPQGDWTIVRFGYQPTGRSNHPAPPAGKGLEIDKMSKEAVDFYWENSISKIIAAGSKNDNKALQHILIDSYEVGHQNWNKNFERDFQNMRGYNPIQYLPALTGRVVENIEFSEKFLWDFRKTINDLIVENYYAHFASLAEKKGLSLSAEAYGQFGNANDFDASGKVHTPMAEWWASHPRESHTATAKLAASTAHTYNRKLAGAEAFTGDPKRIFEESPRSLKAEGDYFMCMGINQFNLHGFAHDPYDVAPGLGLGTYGSRFDRRNTWWPYVNGWFDYVARCQYLLQQGRFIADLLYYVGEDAPLIPWTREKLNPALPQGYDFDFCNLETLSKLEMKDGFIELPGGMQYRILILPEKSRMTLRTLQLIERLVASGAKVIGSKPSMLPGLEGGSNANEQFEMLTAKLWGNTDGISKTKNQHGKGIIYWGVKPATILGEMQITPDFSYKVHGNNHFGELLHPGSGVEFIHRIIDGADVYFVSNQHDKAKVIEATFRVNSMFPEFWYPETGRIEKVCEYSVANDGRMSVTMRLEESEAVFVVFRQPLVKNQGIVSVTKNGQPANLKFSNHDDKTYLLTKETGTYHLKKADGTSQRVKVKNIPTPLEVKGPWKVSFTSTYKATEPIEMPSLISLSEHANEEVKHFSGTAVYDIGLIVPSNMINKNQRITLDLGVVQVIAEVILNGKSLGVVWKPPYRVDVTDMLVKGKNSLQIKVANQWVNRLIGDRNLPDDCEWTTKTGSTAPGMGLLKVPEWVVNNTPRPSEQRKAFVGWQWPHLAEKEVLPSGLIGPVHLVVEVEKEIK